MSKATKIIPTSEVLPPEKVLPDGFAELFQHAYLEAVNGVRRIIVFGLMAIEAKERMPHGGFKAWIREHCPQVHYYRAWQFVKLTKCIVTETKSKQLFTFDRPSYELLALPDAEVPEEVKPIRDEIFNLIDGKSVYQLELDFGVRKPMKGPTNNNPEGKNGGKPQPFHWTPAVLRMRARDVFYAKGSGICHWIDEMRGDEPQHMLWNYLELDELTECTALIDNFAMRLKQVLKDRRKKEAKLTTGGKR